MKTATVLWELTAALCFSLCHSWYCFICYSYQLNIYIYIYLFQWGAQALRNMLIVPPGSGIVHQVNLEYLARVVFNSDGLAYPDSLVGTDSHTTMINGLGVVGWGELSFLPLVYIKSIRNWIVLPIILDKCKHFLKF